MSDDDITIIGERIGLGDTVAGNFGIRRADRRSHLYGIGKTGTGKSTLLERLILQDIVYGEGVALLDPHGAHAEKILDFIPPERTDDLCYFNPADLSHPIGFNPFQSVSADRRHLAVSGFVAACEAIWHKSWGERMAYILKNSVAALIELPGTTLLHLPRLLSDAGYRTRVSERLADPVVRRFWQQEFAGYSKSQRGEYVMPIQNKIGQLLLSPAMRNVFGQEKSAFSPRFVMDHRRIFIANLSKGKLGVDEAHLLGSLLVSSFELAAAARADVPEAEYADRCPDFYFYADEFQNFATDSFASVLSEARKYRLCLSLFHQFEDQLSESVRRAVFGNIGTIIAFRVGQRDADHLSREFEHELSPEQLTNLERFQIAIKLLDRGAHAVPFRALTQLPDARRYGEHHNMIEQSRMRFGKPRERVERAIARVIG